MNKKLIGAISAGGLLLSGLGGAAVLDTASAAAKVHTWKFVSKDKGSHQLGRNAFAGVDVNKKKGETVGYDIISGTFDRQTEKLVLHVAVARKGGLLYGRLSAVGPSTDFSGKVTGGSGKFKGAAGTIDAHEKPNGNTKVIIKWFQ